LEKSVPGEFAVADSEAVTPDTSEIRPIRQPGINRLVIFRALRLGDMLCAVPALRALRGAHPHAHICLVGLPWAEQFAGRFHAYIDDFYAFPGHPAFPEQMPQHERIPAFYREMRARRFDLAVQLHGSGEISNGIVREFGATTIAGFTPKGNRAPQPGLFVDYPESGPEPLRLLALTDHLGAPSATADLEFPITGDDEQELHDAGLSKERMPNDYICIHPGASVRGKCWPPERFAQVADALALEFALPVVLTGSDKERDLTTAIAARMRSNTINAAAPISIGAMAALISRARLLVCNDTGVSHIAAALKLPSVVVFSLADMSRWAPPDRTLHRCIRDPDGKRAATVLLNARALLFAPIGSV
jgi:ADP-heptose:LPS heptosyltransferase